MKRADTTEIAMRIIIERPVPGVWHSLQSRDGNPLDPQRSADGEPLAFDFAVRVGPGPKFFGDQVRREGPPRAPSSMSVWVRRRAIMPHPGPAG